MGKDPMPVFVFGCISCGKTVAGNEPRCPRCGASFEGVMFECPFCGELVSPAQQKCPKCETEFSAFSEDVSETSSVNLDGEDTGTDEGPQQPSESEAEVGKGATEFECPACGKSVSESDTRCPHCGANFQ
jgi:rubrerythrin